MAQWIAVQVGQPDASNNSDDFLEVSHVVEADLFSL
jgi:hypothetical protein